MFKISDTWSTVLTNVHPYCLHTYMYLMEIRFEIKKYFSRKTWGDCHAIKLTTTQTWPHKVKNDKVDYCLFMHKYLSVTNLRSRWPLVKNIGYILSVYKISKASYFYPSLAVTESETKYVTLIISYFLFSTGGHWNRVLIVSDTVYVIVFFVFTGGHRNRVCRLMIKFPTCWLTECVQFVMVLWNKIADWPPKHLI